MTEVEVYGKSRGFIFGTYTLKIIREQTGINTVEELWQRLFPDQQKETSIEYLDFLTKFFYCCALHYTKSKKQEVDFSEIDVSDWLDEIGKEKSLEIFSELVKTYTEKNMTAPQKVGQDQPQ